MGEGRAKGAFSTFWKAEQMRKQATNQRVGKDLNLSRMLPMHETWGNKIFPTPRTSLPPKPCRSRVAPKGSNGQIGLNPLEVLEQVLLLSSSNLKSLGRSISRISVPVFSMFLLSSAFRFPGCCSYRSSVPVAAKVPLNLHLSADFAYLCGAVGKTEILS